MVDFLGALSKAVERVAESLQPVVRKVVRNGRATIVFFADGSKSVVKRGDGQADDQYNAICAAIAKRVVGSGTKLKQLVENVQVQEREIGVDTSPFDDEEYRLAQQFNRGWDLSKEHLMYRYDEIRAEKGDIDLGELFQELFDRTAG